MFQSVFCPHKKSKLAQIIGACAFISTLSLPSAYAAINSDLNGISRLPGASGLPVEFELEGEGDGIRHMFSFQDKLYASLDINNHDEHDNWVYDGTTLTKDTFFTNAIKNHYIADDDLLYYSDHSSGYVGIYQFNGANATQVEIGPELYVEDVFELAYFDSKLFISAQIQGNSLPAAEGVILVGDPNSSAPFDILNQISGLKEAHSFTVYNNKMYFVIEFNNNTQNLYVYDPSGGNLTATAVLSEGLFNIRDLTVHQDKLYFVAENSIHLEQLWSYDSTATNDAEALEQITSNINSNGSYDNLVVYNDKLFFIHGNKLQVYDGSQISTLNVAGNSPPAENLIIYDNRLYYSSANSSTPFEPDYELFFYDDIAGTSGLVADISDLSYGSLPEEFTVHQDKLFFSAILDVTSSSTPILEILSLSNSTPPVITEGNDALARTIDEDQPLNLTLNASHPDNESLTWRISSEANQGTAVVSSNPTGNSQQISYTPNANVNGNDSFTVEVTGKSGGSDSIMVDVTISSVNDRPVISVIPNGLAVEGVPFSISFKVSDADEGQDALSVGLKNNRPSWLSISPETSIIGDVSTFEITGTPSSEDIDSYEVCTVVDDGSGADNATADSCFTLDVDRDLDGDNIGDSLDNDIDGDGIDNTYETANGLNPRDGSDAAQDKDGDGVSNLDEFTAGSNAQADDYAPIITLEDEITLDATALKTRIPANLATANDALDGAVEVNANLASTLLAPGKHTVIWSASDAAGNKAEKEQIINIRPLANWQVNQQAAEGNNLTVSLFLNGEAPEYPVVANYTVTGSATNPDDHNAQSGSLTIENGSDAQLALRIAADSNSEGDENIIFTLDSISNAVIGKQATHEVMISEQNHAPAVSLNATSDSSNTMARTLFASNSGAVTVTASVNDVDEGDSHSLEWEADNALGGTANGSSYQFDPATAGPGVYQITVTATDDADSPASGSAIMTLTIVDALPALGSEDSDGDGISDQEEGFVDSDGDNVPDFADNVEANNLLAIYPLGGEPVEGAWFVESQAGLNLKLNVYGSNSGDYSPLVEDEDLVDNNAADKSDNGFIYDNGIFDFVVSNMPVQGESVNVIIPQVNAIPAGAVYRKELNGRWAEFVEDANNKVSSAAGERGVCPPPGSDDYQQGLTAGHYCVQLTIEDGGANDADGKADGNIVDPGGVAIQFTTVHSRKGGAFGLLLVSLFGAAYYLRRRIVTPFTQR